MAGTTGRISKWRTARTFLKVGTCSEALFNVLDRANGDPLLLEERAAMPFAGGIVQHGYQCGLLWGAALAAGARAFQLFGSGAEAEARALEAARRIVASMRSTYGEIDCMELTGTDWRKSATVVKYFIKGGTFKCFSMAGSSAPSGELRVRPGPQDGRVREAYGHGRRARRGDRIERGRLRSPGRGDLDRPDESHPDGREEDRL